MPENHLRLMPMIRTFLVLIQVVFCSLFLNAQAGPSLDSMVREINFYADIVVNAEKSEHRQRAQVLLSEHFDQFLQTEGSFQFPLDSIPWLYVLPGDGFRLVSWQLCNSPESYTYYAFLQWPDRHVYFKDSRPFINGAAFTTFTPGTWYGAVYYHMIPFEKEKQTFYLLLGYNAENSLMNTKVVDVLDLSGSEPKLGVPVFTGAEETQTRVLVSYSDIAPARVQYDESLKGVVIDHVAPVPGIGPGGETLPVPDGSLEAWLLKKGDWVYEAEVYNVKQKEPPMTRERENRAEEKDILGRPKNK